MNYNEYNNKIDLSDELYEKTFNSVKSAVSKHNQAHKKRKTALLSAAACFVVFACSISAMKYSAKNPAPNTPGTAVGTPTEEPDNESSIKITTGSLKYPHKIIIDNKIYSQYYFGDAKGDKNNNIELKQSEISELICEIDYFNLTDDLTNFEPMSPGDAKTNRFYKAKAYRYSKAESDNVIIVQAKDKYYLFYLDGLTTDYTIEELFNIYTANGANKIAGIEIWQDEFYKLTAPGAQDTASDEVRPLQIGTIKNQEAINSILTILNNNHSAHSNRNDYLSEYDKALKEYYDSGLMKNYPLMSEYGVYKFKIIFSDGSELIPDKFSLDILVKKDSFCFCICAKEDKTNYLLDNSGYDKLTEIIHSAIQ